MTAQLSREDVESFIKQVESDMSKGWEVQAFELKLAKHVLAGMGSKPVAYRWSYGENTKWRLTEQIPSHGDNAKCPRVIQPLYAAPPAPVSEDVIMRLAWELVNLGVDEKTRQDKKQLFELVKIGIERARIILKAQEWIKCSERMPPLNNGQMWIYSPTRGVQFMFALAASGDYYDTCDSEEDITDATHWMPISIPAAPEQE